jgi:hypothetical protein
MECATCPGKITTSAFLDVMATLIAPERLESLCRTHAPVPRRAPKLEAGQVLTGLVYHQLQPAGALAEHAAQLHGVSMSDSAHAQRRRVLPLELFEELLLAALRPLADAQRHPEAFHRGWRLVGVDGTEWSASNAPAIRRALPKAASRRFESAFAKLRLVSLVELGVHNPLAAVGGPSSEGEQTMATRLWPLVPEGSLVLLDRLFGTPRTLHEATQAWEGRNVACLVRVKGNLKSRIVQALADGSALVEVTVAARDDRPAATLRLREIRAQGARRDGTRFDLRLWTTLLDDKACPAQELAELYARRWEQEIFYRELKLDVRGSGLLSSHTVETALQEIAALVLAAAVVARVRVAAAEKLGVPPIRVSFLKLLVLTTQLWQTFAWGRSTRTPAQAREICEDYFRSVKALAILPERRKRSCPRVVRQPVKAWPRKLQQPSHSGPVSLRVTRLS